jgi:hypothetical protein
LPTGQKPVFPTKVKSVIKIDAAFTKFTYLQTARFRIVEPTGVSKLTRCVLDSGSQSRVVSSSNIDVLNLDIIDQRNLAVSAFESSTVMSRSLRLVRLQLRGVRTNSSTTIAAFDSVYEFLPQRTVPRDFNIMTHYPKLQFADPWEQEDLPIEILVGGELYWNT